MAKQEDGKKFWLFGQVDESLHTAVLELATLLGKHPSRLVEMALELLVVTTANERKEKGLFVPATAKLEAILSEDRAQQLRINQVKMMAYNHVQNPSDETAEKLAEACDLIGVSVEAILEQVSANPHAAEFIGDGKTLTSVETFLFELIKPGKQLSASAVLKAGEARGFKPYLIKEAKRKLGIQSRRDKQEWIWYFPDKNQPQTQEEEAF